MCANVAAMFVALELITGSTTRTKLASSSHGGSTGRGGVRQAHWLTAASFEKSRDLCRWGGARISGLLLTGESYTQEMQHAKRDFLHNDIANCCIMWLQCCRLISCPRALREIYRRRTCGIDVRGGLSLTHHQLSHTFSVNAMDSTSFSTSMQLWCTSWCQQSPDMWNAPLLV